MKQQRLPKEYYQPWAGLFPNPLYVNDKEPEPKWKRIEKKKKEKPQLSLNFDEPSTN